MKPSEKLEIRGYIKVRCSLGITAEKILNEVHSHFGINSVSKSTVYRWFKAFTNGLDNVKDRNRSGRPQTAITSRNIAAVKNLIIDDARYTVREIAYYLNLSTGTIQSILTKELNLRKVCARWVPHLLTEDQKKERVRLAKETLKKFKNLNSRKINELITGDETWIYYFEPQRRINNKQWLRKDQARPTIAKRTKSAKKVMYAVFFNSQGPVVQVAVAGGKTVTGKFYRDKILKRVNAFYENRRPRTGLRGLYLIHDNASSHKCDIVQRFIEEEKIVQVKHPPYSPDLSPCDFFLFPEVKKRLSGRRYASHSALESALYQCLLGIPKGNYSDAFRRWIDRLQKCIRVHGNYFEGLK
ncbi:histone-lysine N-methyltransferase SETMAR-like [Ruditapes philippinarum]|uniref:histone-lysine N-methyltransferase SETMAR-like n=1 Tax=Ruditapes philippinarum TaxID=129788 RepID=UPI00295A8F1D|nr:histone-lysine N-methyltransferase SETMAR-like [Ruditapes philippinarum]